MRKLSLFVFFAGAFMSVQYGSSADDEPAPPAPPVNATICYELTGGTEGCGSTDAVSSCPAAPPAGAANGSTCGKYTRVYSSPNWDKVMEIPPGSTNSGNYPDWTVDYLCKVEMDCVVAQHLTTGLPVCDVDILTATTEWKTKIQLNFDDPCNLSP
jgi:hypothetical protein